MTDGLRVGLQKRLNKSGLMDKMTGNFYTKFH